MRGTPGNFSWLLGLLFLTCPLEANYDGGSGTPGEPYLINTAAQLNAIGAEPNDWDKHFKLGADIDLNGLRDSSFNLIGSDMRPFKGVFDGNGHTISNLTYFITGDEPSSYDDYAVRGFGLFRIIDDPNAVIKDLVLANPDMRPASTCRKRLVEVGALAGSVRAGSLSNCLIEDGEVTGETFVGGLVGSNSGVITDCRSSCRVRPAEERSLPPVAEQLDRRLYFGGLVGFNNGEISNCSAAGEVSGERSVGGLVGETYGAISNSRSSGEVSGDASVGGLIGKIRRSADISHCFATGRVSGRRNLGGLAGSSSEGCDIYACYATGSVSGEEYAGGLVGWHDGSISACYATGLVTDANEVGGLVGSNQGTIRMSCAHGHVSGRRYAGGLIGFNRKYQAAYIDYEPVVSCCYATGAVRGEDAVGGLIGYNSGDTVLQCYSAGKVTGLTEQGWTGGLIASNGGSSAEKCFWDTEASGMATSDGGVGKVTAEMQNIWTYLGAGWDFAEAEFDGADDIWMMCSGRPIYPKLAWEPVVVGDFVEPEGVDLADLAFLGEWWLQRVALPCDSPDLTVDALIDFRDIARMAPHWGHGARQVIFETSLDETPDFTTGGQWQFGMPAGLGGAEHGQPDPTAGYTGDNVYGVNLRGDYAAAVDEPHYLIAGPFDCSQYRELELRFARWLNTDEADYVRATIEFSTDGIGWALVWEHENAEAVCEDDVWQVVMYSLGAMADHRESLYIRWGYEITDDEAWPMSGWNIDDIGLSGVRP